MGNTNYQLKGVNMPQDNEFDDVEFPHETIDLIINKFSIEEENLQDMKEFIHYCSNLSPSEVSDLVNALYDNLGV